MDRQHAEQTGQTVLQAQAGDQRATDELIGTHLPLVYNIVGRALGGHPDTDDVVQETMLRAVDQLPALREPGSFRSWLVAIAMNQIRRRHQVLQQSQLPIDPAWDSADPGADFVDLTIVRLGLSGQRREVAEATRWLDEGDRELLSLWWLEAAGELSRADLAGAMELPAAHAAVRVQRMKGQLETARVVVRALAAQPACPPLAELTGSWDGVPSALWRKRIARHARECGYCSRQWADLFPAEGLLAGLALLPLPHPVDPATLLAAHASSAAGSGSAPTAGGLPADGTSATTSMPAVRPGRAELRRAAAGRGKHGGQAAPTGRHGRRAKPGARRRVLITVIGTAVVTVAAVGVVGADQEPTTQSAAPRVDATAAEFTAPPAEPTASTPAPSPAVSSAAPTSASPTPSASTASPKPSPSPSSAPPSPSPTPTPSAAPTPSATPSPSPSRTATTTAPTRATTAEQQVLDLVNSERAKNNCGPLKANAKLQAAAQGHSDDMAARNFFDHTNPDGKGPQPRIEATGYQWSTWGENIAKGQKDAAAVMNSWMNSPGHRANILNCAFTELGVGIHTGSGGPWWTQNFGTPG
ncbi:sigma-70 family RNA polymerase sigma factor [Kitasatospora sp. NPDC096147]|uniref:sigma-70 family RNA polymerase sigma factor n=1 Tax=Kitasatospora sp. NPDC096147 TaxID=3364093 RepID=UPI0038142DCA